MFPNWLELFLFLKKQILFAINSILGEISIHYIVHASSVLASFFVFRQIPGKTRTEHF